MSVADHSPKKVLFITGTRADFGKLKPLMREVDGAEGLECHVFVTGMHMLARYGSTFEEIEKCGFKNLFRFFNQTQNSSSDMDLVLANTISGLGHYVRECQPDLIVVHGDRIEALAGATVGALRNILVAHVEGGELSGTVDELIRHAITKLSHHHFVANDQARQRLVQMGEPRESVGVIGSPEVDVMLSNDLPTLDEARERYEIPFDDYGIFVFHPVTTELGRLDHPIRAATAAIEESNWNFVVIYPNNDSGSDIILNALAPLEDNPRFRLFPSLRFEYFLTLLKHARAIVGNSSAGVREAPVYGVPTVNIGSRQLNRNRSASIINVGEDREAILWAMRNLPDNLQPSLNFGAGDSARQFLKALQRDSFWNSSRQKQFHEILPLRAAAA